MQKVYIIGSSLISALGNNKLESIKKIQEIEDKNYQLYLKESFEEINFYKIKQRFNNQHEKFYSVIKKIIKEAILDSKLSQEEAKDLHVFFGSTSMHISINEEENANFMRDGKSYAIKEIGYGFIGDFIEDFIGTNNKTAIIQSACTSSSNAFSYAADLIKNNKIKNAIVIGVEIFNQATFQGFNSLMLLSEKGRCRPFDKNSDGIVLGEACSAVILSSEKKSPDDFEVLSFNSTFDNYSVTNSNPDGQASFLCMKGAIDKANISLGDITCLKSHSTGSPSSSFSEAVAIDKLFDHYQSKTDVIALKPFIGHTLGACGTNEITLLCECVKNGFIPTTFGFKEKFEGISFDVSTKRKKANKATILFNHIGFGGSNNSIILSNK